MPTPQDTIELMSVMLRDNFLTDSMCRDLHHRDRGLVRHLKYLFSIDEYKKDSRNIKFHYRLASLYAEFKDMRNHKHAA